MRVVITALCLLLAGCTVTVASTPSPDPAIPQDRDERAVLAALRSIDPCELVGGPATGLGPHRCRVRSGGYEFLVRLGAGLDSGSRLSRYYPRALGGAKVYLERFDTTSCAAHLPVSFELSIRVDVLRGPCSAADQVVETAARRLPTLRPAELPMGDWDACTMLTAALPRSMYTYETDLDRLGEHAMDGCVAAGELPDRAPPIRLSLSYGPDPKTADTIGGMPVAVARVGSQCRVIWSNGAVGAADQLVTVLAPTCDLAREITSGALSTTPEPDTVAPQRPLLYGPDEPDLPLVGVCVHVGAECRPHTDAPLPADPADLPAAAADDADLTCVVARDAVRERFGDTLADPVTTYGSCYFTESTRTVWVSVAFVPPPERDEHREGWTRTDLAGLEAWTSDREASRDIVVVLASEYRLQVSIGVEPPPGAKRTDPPDRAPLEHVRGIAEDIVTTYLV